MKKTNILVAGAWPNANGSLHIGHLAALLPGDVIARFHRAKGDDVYYVSGSDCYGTPVPIRARQDGKTPAQTSDFFHEEFARVFRALGFSYDRYSKTSSEEHIRFVREFHGRMYESDLIYEKEARQAYCPDCKKPVTDRQAVGKCPFCGENARGEQCDSCGAVLEAEQLIEPVCAQCGARIELRNGKQLYIALSRLEEFFADYLSRHSDWRKNAVAFTKRYIDEGLRDRAITRDIDWGIDVPKDGFEGKKIYVWAENVLGYLSQSYAAANERGADFAEIWGENAKHYYVHGKDNIPFHTIILPALLLAHGGGLRLPDAIISSEYMTLEGRRISTSGNWAIWVKDVCDRYNPDALRYFFISNGPEKRDADFSWREFFERNNGELAGVYGNFVNRTLVFIKKYFDGKVPEGILGKDVKERIEGVFPKVGGDIERGRFKDGIERAFELARFGNKYFDGKGPWKTRLQSPSECENTLFNCVQIIANLAAVLCPFLPFSSEKIFGWLGVCGDWRPQYVSAGRAIPETEILFERLEKAAIDEELRKLECRGDL